MPFAIEIIMRMFLTEKNVLWYFGTLVQYVQHKKAQLFLGKKATRKLNENYHHVLKNVKILYLHY